MNSQGVKSKDFEQSQGQDIALYGKVFTLYLRTSRLARSGGAIHKFRLRSYSSIKTKSFEREKHTV